ncbi:MAG: ATP synthase F1 subunit gamma [Candidatus Methylacidiphilales bacterium]
MPSLRDIRRRIKSVKNTAQITKAMQMVAASKMRKAQDAAVAGRPFVQLFNRVLTSIIENGGELQHPLLSTKNPKAKPAVLVITTDKGLCGPLNTNLLREVGTLPTETTFVSVGRKGRQFLARTSRDLLADFSVSEKVTFAEAKQISKFILEKFLAGEVSSYSIYYSRFKNTLVQTPFKLDLLPIVGITRLEIESGLDSGSPTEGSPVLEYQFEPAASAVLDYLLPQYIHFLTYQAILSSRASEHSARMVAMKNATDNAKQLVKDLTLEYNKARQAGITNEILEIASAQMAMN